ncbi:unnamed protein product, partial [Mesorhabditis belari]|uniref:C2H2-type domain-containing protein n=1 Tax=Mesorhabditis belari TaxID=2138241 RepID=A0AAF3EH94_9BILA
MTSIGLPPLRLRHDTGSRCRLDAYKYNGSEFVEDTAMSSTFDEEPRRQPEGWPPTHHESLQHMPVHTPMQVNGRCSESSGSPLYPHPLAATGRWLHHPVPGFPQIPQPPSPFFHHLPTSQAPPPFAFIHEEANKKVAEWHAANNNSTLGQQIWQKQARELEEQRKKSIENGKKSPPAYLIETIPLPTQVSPPANKADLIAPKAIHGDTRRLLEPSSSLSPEETKSNGQPSFAGSHSATDSDEDGHRMEVDPPNGATSPQRPTGTREEPTLASQTLPFLALPPLPPRPASCNPKVSTSLPKRDEPVDSNANKQLESREDDPSSLLLNFSNQSFINRAAILGNLGLPTGDGESLMTPIPSALDQIRAFTENPALLPDSPTLANALGAVSQVINMSSPEKADDPSKPAGSARSRSSKQKVYKCKQCPHTDTNKDDHWAHARTHIPADKQMNCPQCMFVTEYKHHLEYHIRNHIGSKPFRCEKCAYMCVNKSMLNSHMKSHNNVYQFRCADCTYATKYCHSLKQHLKKYGHRKRSDEGDHSQTPQSIGSVDSAFQRLTESVGLNIGGPLELKPPLPPTTLAQSLGLGSPFSPPHGLNYPGSQPGPLNLLLRQNPLQLDQLPGLLPGLPPPNVPLKCTVCEFSTGSQEDMIRHNMTHLNLNLLAQVSQSNSVPLPPFLSSLQLPPLPPLHPPNSHDSGIDVVKEESDGHEMTPEHEIGESSGCSSSPMGSSGEEEGRDGEGKRKRKMRKLEEISARLSQGKSPSQRSDDSSAQDNNNDDDALVAEPSSSPSDVHVDSLQRTPPAIAHPMPTLPNVEGPLSIYQQALLAHISSMQMKRDEENQAFRFMCPHCKMAFADQSLYHIHMGYHGYEHVFQCQRCGHHAHDPLNFNLHLLQASHQ